MAEHIHWKKTTNPDYLGAYAFDDGKDMIVKVKDVRIETVQNQQGKEDKPVMYFDGDVKPLILNTTNCKAIAKVWGTPYIEDWAGHKITLKVKKISAFGEMVDAVRVSNERPTDEVIICEICKKPIQPAQGKTAQGIASATKIKYGKSICIECAKREVNN